MSQDGIVLDPTAQRNSSLEELWDEMLGNDGMFGGDVPGGIGITQTDGAATAIIPSYYYEYWSYGIVYWQLASNAAGLRSILLEAIAEIQSKTCIIFKEKRSSSITRYIQITANTGGCWSYVGMYTRGSQQANMENPGCWYRGIVIHELMHAIGFIHEHQRNDRDGFIDVHLENVLSGYSSQFDKYSTAETVDTGSPYDYFSIMHYDLYAFGKTSNGRKLQTIFPKQPGINIQHVAYRPYLSGADAHEVNQVYSDLCADRRQANISEVDGDPGAGANGASTDNTESGSSSKGTKGFMRSLSSALWGWITHMLSFISAQRFYL